MRVATFYELTGILLEELRTHDGNTQDGYILRGERGDSLDLHNLANRVIKPTLEAVGIEWSGYYSCRRGAGTITTVIARDRGLAAKGLLRHKTLTTTAAHYIDSVQSETRAAVEQASEELRKHFQNLDPQTQQEVMERIRGCFSD